MWKEWFGLEDFKEDDFLGGIEHLETTYSNLWRKNFNAAKQKQVLQLKCIIQFVKGRVAAGESLEAMLEEGDELMQIKNTLMSLHNHVRKAKSFRLSPTTNQLATDSLSVPNASNTLQTL